jgi:hypothetical protein
MSDRLSDAFQRALDEAARDDRAPNEGQTAATARMRSVAFGAPPGSGGRARFGLALDWADEPANPAPPPQPRPRQPVGPPGDPSAEIAAELGIGAPLTLEQLTARWRDFVWRNHPDRQPADACAQANARMAIANALYDRARRQLVRARP